MKTKQVAQLLATALFSIAIGCSDMKPTTTVNLDRASDKDLNRFVGAPLSDVKKTLGLDKYPEKIMEGGSRTKLEYRFTLEQKYLFFEVDEGGFVKKGFFVAKPGTPSGTVFTK